MSTKKRNEIMEHLGGNAQAELTAIIEKVENLINARTDIGADITDILDTAESNGFDKRTIREILKLRKLEKQEIEDRENLRDAYLHALGLI